MPIILVPFYGEALGNFVPMEGDIIQAQRSNTLYRGGHWRGGPHPICAWKGLQVLLLAHREYRTCLCVCLPKKNIRTTSSGIRYAKAKVNDVDGVILLPDDWSNDTYSLNNTNSSGASYSSNTITASQWSTLEQAGAVFLPAAGYRVGTSVYDGGGGGHYLSASYGNSNSTYQLFFYYSDLYTLSNGRIYGLGVRLVAPAEN